ncbi:SRPBCC family protein [Gordonia sp. CPCC 205333]|uniref:SRPBCC family protein n=1 Tax=Gordonia sp. CPCC 205333 TaxID=3140790 RepID=UPI003AF34B1B
MQPFARFRFRATDPVYDEGIESFLNSSPFRTHIVYDYPRISADDLWQVVSSDRMWSWLPSVWGCRYPVGEEVAPGTVRDFQMFVHHWLIYAQREKILVWEPGSRLVYTATDATLPFFGTWCEQYVVEPLPSGGSQLTWTMGVKPRFIGWLPMRWLTPVMSRVFRFGLRGLVREVGTGIDGTERVV